MLKCETHTSFCQDIGAVCDLRDMVADRQIYSKLYSKNIVYSIKLYIENTSQKTGGWSQCWGKGHLLTLPGRVIHSQFKQSIPPMTLDCPLVQVKTHTSHVCRSTGTYITIDYNNGKITLIYNVIIVGSISILLCGKDVHVPQVIKRLSKVVNGTHT